MLEKGIPHSPMREPNSIGIVIESARREIDKGIFQGVRRLNISKTSLYRFANLAMSLLLQDFV